MAPTASGIAGLRLGRKRYGLAPTGTPVNRQKTRQHNRRARNIIGQAMIVDQAVFSRAA